MVGHKDRKPEFLGNELESCSELSEHILSLHNVFKLFPGQCCDAVQHHQTHVVFHNDVRQLILNAVDLTMVVKAVIPSASVRLLYTCAIITTTTKTTTTTAAVDTYNWSMLSVSSR